MLTAACFFANCDHPAVFGSSKCVLHKHRTKCVVDQCANQVYARNLCVRHGGKKKCTYEDCQLNARIGEFCSKHGGKSSKAICTHEGCTKQAHKRKKCVRHGGGRKCNVDGCDVHARRGGYCARHGRQAKNGNLVSSPTSTESSKPPQAPAVPIQCPPRLTRLALDPLPRLGITPRHAFPPYNTAYRSSPSAATTLLPFMHPPQHRHYEMIETALRRDHEPFAPPYALPPPPAPSSASVRLPALGFIQRGPPPTMAPVAYGPLSSYAPNDHVFEVSIRQ
ncbi:hypothetical protein H310_05764 [Aphanomyces invadans]|uniref:Uncharacterized protein n=1 Tax=Aphanomyces invadans TaxID=157072 RepID=A0A024U8H6_9STRA|nr:hypothetical protein H310_05764 [Aphanomyces invadans]ETW02197.1 hypothetical protein H310_05764 [Aphanomyces invadans]|eukprot:XP_008868802.1 hypothetical protein H310_05764 [Aphanomyces invadans]